MNSIDRQLVASYARCRQCGTVLQSLYGHDYKTCRCGNETMVDGGLEYGRYGGMDMSLVEKIDIYADDPFELVRKHCYRAGYGKDKKGAYRITRLFEMTDEHLRATLEYGCALWQEELIRKEIIYRKENNISIPQ